MSLFLRVVYRFRHLLHFRRLIYWIFFASCTILYTQSNHFLILRRWPRVCECDRQITYILNTQLSIHHSESIRLFKRWTHAVKKFLQWKREWKKKKNKKFHQGILPWHIHWNMASGKLKMKKEKKKKRSRTIFSACFPSVFFFFSLLIFANINNICSAFVCNIKQKQTYPPTHTYIHTQTSCNYKKKWYNSPLN